MLVLKGIDIDNRVDDYSALIYHYMYKNNDLKVEVIAYGKPNEKIKISYKGYFINIVKSNPKLSYSTFPVWSIDVLELARELNDIIRFNILFV
jgi:hypothetical protein|nr:MAG TPA: hypothetical protein [Caudoviricetes sp.]